MSGARDRRVRENLISLRFGLGLVRLAEILDRAFPDERTRQDHDADEARRAVGRRLGEHRLRPALVPGGAGAVRRRAAARVDADAALDQAADAGALVPVRIG